MSLSLYGYFPMIRWLKNLFVPDVPLRVECVRSSKWPEVRLEHLAISPACAVCGVRKNVVPHHIKPVHLFPELELETGNLITLCEGPGVNCHLLFGHLNDWRGYNPDVLEDCRTWRQKLINRFKYR